MREVHPAWLPDAALAVIGSRRISVPDGEGTIKTLRDEVDRALAAHGGSLVSSEADLTFSIDPDFDDTVAFIITVDDRRAVVRARDGVGLLAGYFHILKAGEEVFADDGSADHAPALGIRMLNHWDNMTRHPVMGTVERGYAGDSLFFHEGEVRSDLSRIDAYARLLASIGINHISINNVNVHQREAHLLTDLLPGVARIAEVFRRWGIKVHLAVNFASPMILGGLPTCDPLDADVAAWWEGVVAEVYRLIPDFGGLVVKADSEGQPGPFAYGRDHADGANVIARALRPHGGITHWRAFVYNHQQDWRDRTTDRARAAYDHFTPLDGDFDDNVIVQIKQGPLDFQVREAISPLIAAMPNTRLALELQITQEYTGQQRHVCYLGESWEQILGFHTGPDDARVRDLPGSMVAVSNIGTDEFWTGHPMAAANLYAYGRLAWDPTAPADTLAAEWARLTFARQPEVAEVSLAMLRGSWQTYEKYTAPLGVGFMVEPGHHYGPNVDGYEYSKWGTYHFADRDGLGVDRTRATGTGYTAQYQEPWNQIYESVETCPDELLLFFHHVPYTHVLHCGKTVIQHIYDAHFEGVEEVVGLRERWAGLRPHVGKGELSESYYGRVEQLLAEQERSAIEWRDQINTYFLRKSGIPDARQRTIY